MRWAILTWLDMRVIIPRAEIKERRDSTWVTPALSILNLLMDQFPYNRISKAVYILHSIYCSHLAQHMYLYMVYNIQYRNIILWLGHKTKQWGQSIIVNQLQVLARCYYFLKVKVIITLWNQPLSHSFSDSPQPLTVDKSYNITASLTKLITAEMA